MTKQEFITELREKLSGLPKEDIEESISFYSEMIDDRIEEGQTEEKAVFDIGSAEKISAQIIADTPFPKIAKERIKPKRRLMAWEIILLVLGSPLWLSLAAAAIVLILAIYVVLWSVIISLWAVFASLLASSVGVLAAGVVFAISGRIIESIAMIGVSFLCAGFTIFLFFGSKAATKGIILLTKKIALGIKRAFVRKEKNNE